MIGSVYFSLLRTPFVDRKDKVLSEIRITASWAKQETHRIFKDNWICLCLFLGFYF